MKMRMKILAAAISAIGAAGSVQAAVEAQAILSVTNVLFKNDATGVILDYSQFVHLPNPGGLFIKDTTNLNPCLGSTCAGKTYSTNGGVPLPLHVESLGTGSLVNNFVPAPTPPTTDFAKAASQLDGNPITGLPGNPLTLGGADALASSLAQRLTTSPMPATADTAASLTLASVFTFTPTNTMNVRFEFDGYKFLMAYTDSAINSFASVNWNISIRDVTGGGNGVEVFDWSPDGVKDPAGIFGGTENLDPCSLNDSVTAFFPASVAGDTCADDPNSGGLQTVSFSATSGTLTAGRTYNLSITHETAANVELLVPEPSSVLLAGLALAGVGFSARRKARSDH